MTAESTKTARILSPGWGYRVELSGVSAGDTERLAASIERERAAGNHRWRIEVTNGGIDVQLADGEKFAPAMRMIRYSLRVHRIQRAEARR
jgi:hypothetical protein